MVLSDGSAIWCDRENHIELFSVIPFSYGTFGFLTAVDIDVVPYKPYLRHTYIPVQSVQEAVKIFEREANDSSVDTVEGILFSRNESVIMSGKFVDTVKVKFPYASSSGPMLRHIL